MRNNGIPRATMGRLPAYLSLLRSLPKETRTISATAIARGLDLGEVQVRKDLSSVCNTGKPKIGYDTMELSECIEEALGTKAECEAVIVGAGRLGTALLGFGGFSEYGIRIHHAFDIKADADSGAVLPISALPSYCSLHQVEIGIITVPPEAAQTVADIMVKSGIRAIWCFAPVRLSLPEGVSVQYENMALSLAHLHQKIKRDNNETGGSYEKQGKTHCGQR